MRIKLMNLSRLESDENDLYPVMEDLSEVDTDKTIGDLLGDDYNSFEHYGALLTFQSGVYHGKVLLRNEPYKHGEITLSLHDKYLGSHVLELDDSDDWWEHLSLKNVIRQIRNWCLSRKRRLIDILSELKHRRF